MVPEVPEAVAVPEVAAEPADVVKICGNLTHPALDLVEHQDQVVVVEHQDLAEIPEDQEVVEHMH